MIRILSLRPHCALAAFAALCVLAVPSAIAAPAPASSGVQVLLVSDVHFDPFRDPAKVPQLAAAPVEQWRSILDAPASPDRDARLAALEKSCHTRGVDTDEALFVASLNAIRAQARGVKFAAMAGDLMAHAFDCKFETLLPHASDADYRHFSVKTMAYILRELRAALPGVPLYPALGNNDSGCGDYKLDPRSDFLAESAHAFTADVPLPQRAQAAAEFAAFGDYNVALPAPFRHARLVAIDDLFESRRYTGCTGKPNPTPASDQIAWLRAQLDNARASGDRVWVVGHIPPGIDPYSTVAHMRNVCAGQQPEMFLSSTALPEALSAYGDVLSLAVFAHTHMDEMRILVPTAGGHGPVAIKMTPSISPINGNLPSFTLATVDPTTAVLRNYRVIASSDTAGTSWSEEYNFTTAYSKPDYSSTTAAALITSFQADPAAASPSSAAYIRNYFVRDASLPIKAYWPQYTCALANYTVESYRACVCATH